MSVSYQKLRRGFTLLECIIASAVIVLGFLAVASVFPQSYRAATLDQNHTVAVRLAENVLEAVRANPFGSDLPATLLNPLVLPGQVEGVPAAPVTFTPSVAFENGAATGNPGVAPGTNDDVAIVTVEWSDASSRGLTKSFVMAGGISREP